MVKKRGRLLFVSLLCLAAVIFTSCSAGNTEPQGSQADGQLNAESVQNVNVTVYDIPQENRSGVNLYSLCASSTGEGFYRASTGTKTVSFYDARTKRSVILCAQPGCNHTDNTCKAWIGSVSSYVEYRGQLFAIVENENGDIELVQKDISNGTLTALQTWRSSETEFYTASIGKAAYNMITITLTHSAWREDGTLNEEQTQWVYDLNSGEIRQMFPDEPASLLGVMALSEKYAVVMFTPAEEDQNLLTEDGFSKQYGSNASYGRYLYHTLEHELRLYSLNNYTYTVIADTEHDGLISTVDSNYVYGDRVVYQCGNKIYLINASTGESAELLSMDGIINYFILDNKVFLIANGQSDPSAVYYLDYDLEIYFADINDGIPVKLGNGGNTSNMEFSINFECSDFFVGNWGTKGTYIINKQDFYSDNYDNAEMFL